MKKEKKQKIPWSERPEAWFWGQMIFLVGAFAAIAMGIVLSA